MNLYLDTSALVKLYVEEGASAEVRQRVADAEVVGTSQVAYPEARDALARRQREGAFSADDLRRAVADLDRDLEACVVVELTRSLALMAGELAERRGLRGLDAIHLASALELGDLLGEKPSFLCFDRRLALAASASGLAT